jgi:hypothetical protein
MESFVTRSARPRAEAAGGNTHVQNGILEKLRKLRSLDLKSLKLAIEHELKTGPIPRSSHPASKLFRHQV